MPGQLFLRGPAVLDEDLNESAFFLRLFPGQRLFAGGDPHDEIAQAARLTRFHRQVLSQVVALVEHTQRDHALLVGRADALAFHRLCRTGLHIRYGFRDARLFGFGRGLTAAPGKRQQAYRHPEGEK
ncbi:hypothetical protein GCM10011494_06160 [Novosphingobium endophyticum]|uniref:Uncharacterized protein n=1 Tax=Novosphingobium endophyticum TaxID=1955250 RepID=A0A916TPF0_9SPHN|nr:hypothetical protein GCM10011494_06160 [Novosphingobium endophyticum]